MSTFKRTQRGRRRPLAPRTPAPTPVQYYRAAETKTNEKGGRQSRQPQVREASKLLVHFRRVPAYLSIAAILGSIVYCSILGNKVSVIIAGKPLYEKSHYETLAGEALNSSVFNHSKFTITIRTLKEQIKSKLPEVSDVTVSVPLVGRKPVIGLALVPGAYVLSLPDKTSYIVGSNGVILATTSEVMPESYQSLLDIQEDIPQHITPGQKVLSTSDIAFIQTVVNELKNKNISVSQLELPVGASELYVHLKDTPYMIKFALSGDVRQQVGDYFAVRKQLGSQVPSSYIDVRVGERVYVK